MFSPQYNTALPLPCPPFELYSKFFTNLIHPMSDIELEAAIAASKDEPGVRHGIQPHALPEGSPQARVTYHHMNGIRKKCFIETTGDPQTGLVIMTQLGFYMGGENNPEISIGFKIRGPDWKIKEFVWHDVLGDRMILDSINRYRSLWMVSQQLQEVNMQQQMVVVELQDPTNIEPMALSNLEAKQHSLGEQRLQLQQQWNDLESQAVIASVES